MNEKLLLEYVDRVGMVTLRELAEQAGSAGGLLYKPALALVLQKKLFFCRLDHGAETLLSNHLLFCLMSVYTEPDLLPDAQEVFDWLCDNEPATEAGMAASVPLAAGSGFADASGELQRKLCVAPVAAGGEALPGTADGAFTAGLEWVTTETWLLGMHRAGRYRELEYCISEIRRLMRRYFTTRELNNLIYRGAL